MLRNASAPFNPMGCCVSPVRLVAMEDGSLGTMQQRAIELEHMAEVLLTGEQLR